MSISNTTETAILSLIFTATAWANYADNAASSPQTNVSVSLHTADPGDAGTMATSETSYGSYARVDVARSGSGFSVSGGTASFVSNVTFAACTSGTPTLTHASLGKTGGGAAAILFSGTITPNLNVTVGAEPRLTTASTITLD